MSLERWTDFSKWQGDVSNASLQAMKADGVVGICVGSWHGVDKNPYAESVLLRARAIGLKISTYAIINGRGGAWTIRQARDACGNAWEHLSFVASDVELQGVTEAILRDSFAETVRLGQRPLLYTGNWFWGFWRVELGHWPNVGNPFAWLADYDDVPVLDSRTLPGYGPQVAKQIHGSRQLYGTTVDGNVFNSEWLAISEPPVPPPVPPTPPVEPPEEGVMGKILDTFIAAGKAVEAEVAAAKTLPTPIPGPAGPAGPSGPSGGGTPTGPATYTVVGGDTLSSIASKLGLGDWRPLYELNKAVIGPDPNLIQPGMVLQIP